MAAQTMPSSWNLAELLAGCCDLAGLPALTVSGLALDSRQVQKGDVFFACGGNRQHGREFIDEAIAAGAVAVVCESAEAGHELRHTVPVITVPGLTFQIGLMAERFYGSPTRDQFVIGVTGTNGKTSISQFIAQALQADAPCGVIGTLGNGLFGKLKPATHTTPDAISLHAMLDEMRNDGARYVVMEVSSHGLEQGRVAGVAFDVAVFSNLSHEHLDYHGDMASYGRAKQRLFAAQGLKYAVINSDDEFGRQLLQQLPDSVEQISYGFAPYMSAQQQLMPSLLASNLKLDREGLCMQVAGKWGQGELRAPLLGAFNACNLLAALAVLLLADIGLHDALQRLSRVQPVPGRMQGFVRKGQPLVVVDYAHTPDALQQVLSTLREHGAGQVHCVFGCGGERDKAKRPLMGAVAERLADQLIITDDNPRHEDSQQIIEQILQGIAVPARVQVIADRAAAIAQAIARAGPEDIVLIAGKGHEEYQLVAGKRLPFSDAAQVTKALTMSGGVS